MIKLQSKNFFNGSFVISVKVTTQEIDRVGFIRLPRYWAIGTHENHRTEIWTLLPEARDLLAGELDGLGYGPDFSFPILEAAPIYS
jgi:hypothetical protein